MMEVCSTVFVFQWRIQKLWRRGGKKHEILFSVHRSMFVHSVLVVAKLKFSIE